MYKKEEDANKSSKRRLSVYWLRNDTSIAYRLKDEDLDRQTGKTSFSAEGPKRMTAQTDRRYHICFIDPRLLDLAQPVRMKV